MARLTMSSVGTNRVITDLMDDLVRRAETMPPGICPLAVLHATMQASAVQTCGKCVPCRDGVSQLVDMLHQVLECHADKTLIGRMKELATMIRDSADCAIGYGAAKLFLQSFDLLADEYHSHLVDHVCSGEASQTVPCETMCPAHVDVPSYIALVGAGDYKGAVKMIRKDNPFPTACAYVCEHPCEERCRRRLIDAPLNIRGIKKYAVDQIAADQVAAPTPLVATGKRIAVIGGGPSGLSCAYFLALMGHQVVVFEQRKELGGMLRYGIPAYRLPRERLDEDIRVILSLESIEVRTEIKIGPAEIRSISEEYDAVYLSTGAQEGKSLEIRNVDAPGVLSAVELLAAIGDGEIPDFVGKKIAVIGGGNVAMDCARTAVRLAADEVSVIYRRRQDDMTALPIEIESAAAEGVEMITLEAPSSIEVNKAGSCKALITQPQKVQGVKDGRPSVDSAEKPQRKVEADVVLVAIGQGVSSAGFESFGMKVTRGRFVADTYLQAEGCHNIFVGGDCQTGPATAIKAIGAGRVAAHNIDEFLGYHHTINYEVDAPEPESNDQRPMGRVEITERPARERKHDFDHVENLMSQEEAQWECSRCLRCDHFGCGVLEEGRIQYA